MIYKKWRELCINPFAIPYKSIILVKIFSYPPAGNDVIECDCITKSKLKRVFMKIERSKMADFEIEFKHLKILQNERYYNKAPNVYEYGIFNGRKYLILEKKSGERLSNIFSHTSRKYNYLFNYGMELAKIHDIPVNRFFNAKIRKINDYPKCTDYKNIDNFIKPYICYLKENKPLLESNTFVHGDFHYANVLWKNGKVSGVIDFEYSGRGVKEQDIAWCCVKRPGQNFMDNIHDINSFLNGYLTIGAFDKIKFYWCLINTYCHFYLMNYQNNLYLKKIRTLLTEIEKNKNSLLGG